MSTPTIPRDYAPHYKLTLSGLLGTGTAETFSYGLSLSSRGTGPTGSQQQMHDDIVNDSVAYHGRAETGIWGGARLTMVKTVRVNRAGLYDQDPLITAVDVPGGIPATGPLGGFQMAACISLQTQRRGATGRGRYYTPCPMFSAGADGRWDESQQGFMRASAAAWLSALNNSVGPDSGDAIVVVASSKGYLTNVTGVRVGRVPDTIRSRRRQLVEQYGDSTPIN